MLLVPYSSTIETMLLRKPVRIDATAMTTVTPMTMPSTVRKLRNLCARTMSKRHRDGLGWNDRSEFASYQLLVQRHDRIEPRRLIRRIDASDHSDAARHSQRQQDVTDCDRHWDRRRRSHDPRQPGRKQQPQQRRRPRRAATTRSGTAPGSVCSSRRRPCASRSRTSARSR